MTQHTPDSGEDQLARNGRARHLRRSAAISAGGTILSRVTGLLRLVVIAYTLGSASLADAFNLSNNTPNMIHDLVIGGVLAATFVPVFVDRIARASRREATDSISSVVTLSGVLLVAATAVFVLLAPAIIDLYTFGLNDPSERALAVELLRLFAPQLLFYGAISLMTAVLAAQDRFAVPGVVPVINNVVGIIVLLAFAAAAHTTDAGVAVANQGLIVLLGVGTTVAVAAQAAALVPSIRRSDIRVRFRFRPSDPAVAAVLVMSGWTFGFVVANQVALFVVLAIATHLAAVSVYTYAFTFFQFPFAIAATSIIAIATPQIARAFSNGDVDGVASRFHRAAGQIVTVILPATVGYLLLAHPAMTLVLRHGNLTAAGARATANVLILLAAGLPGFCVFFLATRTFQAIRDTRTTFLLYLAENALNVALAFALERPLGVNGLAVSYAVAYTIGAVAAVGVLRRRVGTAGASVLRSASVRAVFLSILMALVVALVMAVIGTGAGVGGWVRMGATVAAGVVAYVVAAGVAAIVSGRRKPREHTGTADRTIVPIRDYQRGAIAHRGRDRQLKRLAPPRPRRGGRHFRSSRRPPWR